MAIHHGLTFLIEHLPPRVHAFVATRADPPLPLARWRARGGLLEVRVDDLRFSATGQRLWVGLSIVMAMYAFDMETIQQLRGIDPRFTQVGGPVDALVGAVFELDALGLIGMFSLLAVRLVQRGTGGADGLVLLALRYAIGATMLAFAAGIWMSINQGRCTGTAGNILPLHAFGFRALQAIPQVAWLFSRSATPDQEARPWVHAAGAAWCAACSACPSISTVRGLLCVDAELLRPADDLIPRPDAKLVQDSLDVVLGGLVGDDERVDDLAVAEPARGQTGDLVWLQLHTSGRGKRSSCARADPMRGRSARCRPPRSRTCLSRGAASSARTTAWIARSCAPVTTWVRASTCRGPASVSSILRTAQWDQFRRFMRRAFSVVPSPVRGEHLARSC